MTISVCSAVKTTRLRKARKSRITLTLPLLSFLHKEGGGSLLPILWKSTNPFTLCKDKLRRMIGYYYFITNSLQKSLEFEVTKFNRCKNGQTYDRIM